MSKIEQIIGEMEEYIDSCRFQPLSNTKIIVNKDEIDDLLDDLRQNIPDEVRKYQRIIANRDAILRDAQDKADEMIRKANEMTSTLVSEHEIMQQAFREANIVIEDANAQAAMIVENANAEANDIRVSAIQYTDDSLSNIQNILNTAIEGMTVKYDGVMRSLESSLEIATKDRQSLREFFTKTKNTPVEREIPVEHVEMDAPPQKEAEPYVDSFVENTFEPAAQEPDPSYDDLTLEDVLGQEEMTEEEVQEPQAEEVPEVSDFDLSFDDFE